MNLLGTLQFVKKLIKGWQNYRNKYLAQSLITMGKLQDFLKSLNCLSTGSLDVLMKSEYTLDRMCALKMEIDAVMYGRARIAFYTEESKCPTSALEFLELNDLCIFVDLDIRIWLEFAKPLGHETFVLCVKGFDPKPLLATHHVVDYLKTWLHIA